MTQVASLALRLVMLLLLLAVSAGQIRAQETERVAAVVNEDVVTLRDLDQRMRLAMASSNIPDTMENRRRIAPQVLRRLIDEKIELQEAAKLKINVSPAEISNGFATIEKQNNMPGGSFESFLKSKNIDPESMRQQIRAELAWVHVMRGVLVPELHISESDIDNRLATLRANLGKPEYLAAEIFVPVEDPSHEEEVRTLMDRLVDQMRQGVPFSALARQFSQTGASSGGDLGWVSEGMFDDELISVLSRMEPGNITQPIRTVDGYHLLLLRDRRIIGQGGPGEPTLDVLSIVMHALPSDTQADRDSKLKRVRDAMAKGKSCDDYSKLVKEVPSVETVRADKIKPSEVPQDVRIIVQKLKVGEISEPLNAENGQRLFVLCNRVEPTDGLPSRDDVRRRIEDEQLDVLARRYLRDLRRAAFVEIRI